MSRGFSIPCFALYVGLRMCSYTRYKLLERGKYPFVERFLGGRRVTGGVTTPPF